MKTSLLFAALLWISSCGNSSGPSVGENHPKDLPEESITSTYPSPDSTLAGIPIYSKFEDFAPLLSLNNDTTYVVNFWATWCKPCVKELPYFIELSKKYATEPVRILLISLDFPGQLQSKLVPFVEKQQIEPLVAVLLDGKYNDWIDRVSEEWSGAIPATVVYKGENRHFHGEAVHSIEELEQVMYTIYQP
ncbi:MAG: redoxin domain-containing protein [Phaeodactylibacter sp.]|nr:redoxin domain-containing protein [Phaeodactylibacter sp.]